jgi:pyruvate dehydrogenase complex dehydrogenase (E1) component
MSYGLKSPQTYIGLNGAGDFNEKRILKGQLSNGMFSEASLVPSFEKEALSYSERNNKVLSLFNFYSFFEESTI